MRKFVFQHEDFANYYIIFENQIVGIESSALDERITIFLCGGHTFTLQSPQKGEGIIDENVEKSWDSMIEIQNSLINFVNSNDETRIFEFSEFLICSFNKPENTI